MFMDMICHIESWITAHIKDAFIYQGLPNHRELVILSNILKDNPSRK